MYLQVYNHDRPVLHFQTVLRLSSNFLKYTIQKIMYTYLSTTDNTGFYSIRFIVK